MCSSDLLYEADQCLAMGLVNGVFPSADLKDITEQMAAEIARNAPLSVRGTKRLLTLVEGELDLSPEKRQEANRLVIQSFMSDDFTEGKRAFKGKRQPEFKGK